MKYVILFFSLICFASLCASGLIKTGAGYSTDVKTITHEDVLKERDESPSPLLTAGFEHSFVQSENLIYTLTLDLNIPFSHTSFSHIASSADIAWQHSFSGHFHLNVSLLISGHGDSAYDTYQGWSTGSFATDLVYEFNPVVALYGMLKQSQQKGVGNRYLHLSGPSGSVESGFYIYPFSDFSYILLSISSGYKFFADEQFDFESGYNVFMSNRSLTVSPRIKLFLDTSLFRFSQTLSLTQFFMIEEDQFANYSKKRDQKKILLHSQFTLVLSDYAELFASYYLDKIISPKMDQDQEFDFSYQRHTIISGITLFY